jgi:hypothetical protein
MLSGASGGKKLYVAMLFSVASSLLGLFFTESDVLQFRRAGLSADNLPIEIPECAQPGRNLLFLHTSLPGHSGNSLY